MRLRLRLREAGDERKIMTLMWRRRRRKMMSRRKTDPKNGKHTLCERAQSKCTLIFHYSRSVWKLAGKMPDTPDTSGYHLKTDQNRFSLVVQNQTTGTPSKCLRSALEH